jgi:signal transduction histidine kinase
VKHGDEWVGAAGVTRPLDETAAGTLAGLTRSDVLILNARGEPAAASVPDSIAQPLAAAAGPLPVGKEVHTVSVGAQRYLVAKSTLGGSASVLFARDLREELAVLPEFRRILVVMGVAALALALLLGALLASRLSRPVRGLAAAADRIGEGDFDAPVEPSRVREIDRLAHAFDAMRSALSAHLGELRSTNRELADREARLTALQSEIIQRERLAASGRMAAELAHEIRNPVASLRNCLELLLRRVQDDPVGREFANLAIDELLRMHELAERMLDLNRPGDPAVTESDAAAVAREVGALVRAGAPEDGFGLSITGEGSAPAAIPPDALKQVLLNLVYNAREARPRDLHLDIQVRDAPPHVRVFVTDNGPGIAADILPQLFDPFFTTKSRTGGVGLGLSVAAGIIRKHGGRMWAENRTDGSGACFGIELPAASQESGSLPDSHSTSPEPVAE